MCGTLVREGNNAMALYENHIKKRANDDQLSFAAFVSAQNVAGSAKSS